MEIDLQKLGIDIGASKDVDEIRAYGSFPNGKLPYLEKLNSQRLSRDFQERPAGIVPYPNPDLNDELIRVGSLEDTCKCSYEREATEQEKSEAERNVVADLTTITGTIAGRGLICSCFNGEYLNATVRKNDDTSGSKFPTTHNFSTPIRNFDFITSSFYTSNIDTLDIVGFPKKQKCNFIPSERRGSFIFSVSDLVAVICDYIPDVSQPGLVIVAGGTGSGKSQIVRGVIYRFLKSLLSRWKIGSKRPHFLTVENPIEKYLFSDNQSTGHASPADVQKLFQLDYTPRQMPRDTPSLEQALMQDALRQTPNLVYVGEIRKPQEFRTVLDFAETGHSVVSTMHASSLQEAMQRILVACEADTPAKRGQIAKRINAIIHIEPFKDKVNGKTLSVPCLWLKRNSGAENLVADGLSSFVKSGAYRSVKSAEGDSSGYGYCIGRTQIFEALLGRILREEYPNKGVEAEMRKLCIQSDMGLK